MSNEWRFDMEAKHTKKQADDETADINDVFHSIALSEERLMKQGFQEGFLKGSLEGEDRKSVV
jgi:hypothetical protein